ncbi:unnamed protein product, partial [Clonostachys rosea f. rosea IK726]
SPTSPQAKDRIWLCTLLAVFALGESYNVGPPPEIRLGRVSEQDEDNLVDSRRPPGTEFFEQAMSLLKISHEDPTIDQIMALNLISEPQKVCLRVRGNVCPAFKCSALAQAIFIFVTLCRGIRAYEARLVDRLLLGSYDEYGNGPPPIFRRDEVELSYPSDQMLPTEAADEFSSGVAFTTQVQLAFIHTDICQTVRSLGDTGMIYDQKRAEPIIQQLETLRAQMPPTLSF